MDRAQTRQMLQEMRRDFHRYPEDGWRTYRTSILIAEELERAGYAVSIGEEILLSAQAINPPSAESAQEGLARCREELRGLDAKEELWEKWAPRMGNLGGVIATYDSGRPGPTLACRFDTDALRISESESTERLPVQEAFASCHEGCFHGCGHDGHTAVGLVTALRVMEEWESLCGKLIFIFQPAEEGVTGAKSYCANWRFGPIDLFLAGHIGFTEPDMFVAGAKQLLATSEIDGEFIGKGAHAATPERGKNALLALAEAVVRMQEIPKPEQGTVRLNVGVMQGGEARNAIPAYASFLMETRGSTNELNAYMRNKAEQILHESAEKYDVECRLAIRNGGEAGDSSEGLSERIRQIAEETGLYEHCVLHQVFGASDDAASFMRMAQEAGGQAAYMLFGCPVNGRHHESGFDFDEEVLEKSCEIWIRIIRDLLEIK